MVEIYFKDWISNALDPATDEQLGFSRVIRREELNLVCLSIRTAYANQARSLQHISDLELPVLAGGSHPALSPVDAFNHDMVLKGEGLAAVDDCTP